MCGVAVAVVVGGSGCPPACDGSAAVVDGGGLPPRGEGGAGVVAAPVVVAAV